MNIDLNCDRFAVAREVPLLVPEAQAADQGASTFLTRFLHNKLTFYTNGYSKCYLSYLSPDTITTMFSIFGLALFLVGLYALIKRKKWFILGSLLVGPALPLSPISLDRSLVTVVMYVPQLLTIIVGLFVVVDKLFSLLSSYQFLFPTRLVNIIRGLLRLDLIIIGVFLLFLPLFFYNLGNFGLADFDEGWYAGISNSLLQKHFALPPFFNGVPFYDHPPLGFVLMGLSFAVFGVNEFAARFPSALLGFFCLIVIYFIGKKLFSRAVGLMSALMLSSSIWFMFRARSGNLDSPFVFFYLLTFLSAILAAGSGIWSAILGFSLASLLLTKSLLGITIVPAILIFFWQGRSKVKVKNVVLTVIFLILPLGIWAFTSFQTDGLMFFNRMLSTGIRSGGRVLPELATILKSTTMTYLHFGMGRWYYFSLVGLVFGLFFLLKKPRILAVYSVIAILLTAFLTNKKTEIWHLIPLYPFLFILASTVFEKTFTILSKLLGFDAKKSVAPIAAVIVVIFLSLGQINSFKDGIHLFDQGESDLVFIAKQAKNYDGDLYLDGHDFFPSVIFYSGRSVVTFMRGSPAPYNSLRSIVDNGYSPMLVITENWRLQADKIEKQKYELLSQRGEATLIRLKNK